MREYGDRVVDWIGEGGGSREGVGVGVGDEYAE